MKIRYATLRQDSSHRSHIVLCLLLLVGAVLASQAAPAQGRPHGHDGRHVDNRWGHNRPYYPHGHSVPHIPHGAYEIHHGGHAYWYHGGQWYQRHGGVSIIVGAPIGAFVPVLPPYYSTVWWQSPKASRSAASRYPQRNRSSSIHSAVNRRSSRKPIATSVIASRSIRLTTIRRCLRAVSQPIASRASAPTICARRAHVWMAGATA